MRAEQLMSGGVPDNWEAAFALMGEQFGEILSELQDRHARELDALRTRVDDLQGLVKQHGDARAQMADAAEKHAAQLQEAIDHGAKVHARADDLQKLIDGQTEMIASLRGLVDTQGETITRVRADLDKVPDDQTDARQRLRADLDTRIDEAFGEIEAVKVEGEKRDEAHLALVARHDMLVQNVARVDEGMQQHRTETSQHMNGWSRRIDTIDNWSADVERRMDDQAAQVKVLTDGRVTISESIDGVMKYATDAFDVAMKTITESDTAASSTFSEIGIEVQQVRDRVEVVTRQAADAIEAVSTAICARMVTVEERLDVAVTESTAALDSSRAALHDTRQQLAVMPRNLVITREGDLLAFLGDGSDRNLGRICGRDGSDAVSLVAAKTDGNALVLVRGDGQEIKCALPAAPVPANAVQTTPAPALKYDVEAMARLRDAGVTWDAIGKGYKITGVHAGRLVKKFKEGK